MEFSNYTLGEQNITGSNYSCASCGYFGSMSGLSIIGSPTSQFQLVFTEACDYAVLLGDTVNVVDQSYNPLDAAVSYEITDSSGTRSISFPTSLSVCGTANITQILTWLDGGVSRTSRSTQSIQVNSGCSTIDFSTSGSCCETGCASYITETPTSFTPLINPNRGQIKWSITGNITESFDWSPIAPLTYTFSSPGVYNIIMKHQDACGNVREISKTISVAANVRFKKIDCYQYQFQSCTEITGTYYIEQFDKTWTRLADFATAKPISTSTLIEIPKDGIYRIWINGTAYLLFEDCVISKCLIDVLNMLICGEQSCSFSSPEMKQKLNHITRFQALYSTYLGISKKLLFDYSPESNDAISNIYSLKQLMDGMMRICKTCIDNSFSNSRNDCGCS